MFYSHNLLARKGPLGTVWCAAHLQNRLKKSNYITINIPSTVEQIMNPQIPIALRMSGHLLLGIVRIYSKKVEYLQHDYNVLRIDISKAYRYADINLPEDANQARFESITLPENFALDLMDIDSYNPNESPDSHLRLNEDISFTDHSPVSFSKSRNQTPAGYIMISVGEDVSNNPSPSPSGYKSGTKRRHREESLHPHTPPPTIEGVHDPDLNHQIESNEDNLPSCEFRRDPIQMSPSFLPDTVEPDLELLNEITKGKTNDSSNLDEIVDDGQPLSPHKQTPHKQTPPSGRPHSEPENVQDDLDQHLSFEIAPSPAPASQPATQHVRQAPVAEQPRVKRRRIKYDQATVLTNEFMKKSIDDARDLKRKRKGVSTFLGVWKLNNAHKKERVLSDPLITGMCDSFCEMFEDGYISKKPHLMLDTEEADIAAPEIARRADFVDTTDTNMIDTNSPDNRSFSSPPRAGESTPTTITTADVGSKSNQVPTTIGTSVRSTPDPTSSVGSFVSEMETPFPFSQSHQGFENSVGLSDIPEVEDAGDLSFIEEDDGTPIGVRGSPDTSEQQRPPQEFDLLPRTRAVAQYIKEKSAATPSSSEAAGSVSLDSILQGKTRKVCARMFFETLVLKTRGLIDVKQDVPYGDITLNVTPKLSNLQFIR